MTGQGTQNFDIFSTFSCVLSFTYFHSYWDLFLRKNFVTFSFVSDFVSLSTYSMFYSQVLGSLFKWNLWNMLKDFEKWCKPSLWTWWTSSSLILKANPKSIHLKTPSWLDQRILAGLRSAWTIPCWWRAYRATRISWANFRQAHGDKPLLSFL